MCLRLMSERCNVRCAGVLSVMELLVLHANGLVTYCWILNISKLDE